MMNEGATLDQLLHEIELPEKLLARPYLRPTYDHPLFVVRNLWRLYGGWYDGNPAHLLPAREVDLACALAALAGGSRKLIERAEELAGDDQCDVACELAEIAWRADPEDEKVRGARAVIYRQRAAESTSLMAKGVFEAAARDCEKN